MKRAGCGAKPPKDNSIVKGKKKDTEDSYVLGTKANMPPKSKSQSPKMKVGKK